MGVSWHTMRFLCEAKRAGVAFDRTLTIGRQSCAVSVPKILQICEKYGIEPPPGMTPASAGLENSDPIFQCLGADVVDSVDASGYEGAARLWDMNRPVPEDWHEQYDLLHDGGSIEHIFNVPQVLANYMNLVRVGGHVIIDTPANNWCGHGFFQFSPEFFYRVFAPANGFAVERLVLYEMYEFGRMFEVPDPAQVRSRIEMSNSWIGISLLMLARRAERLTPFASWPQQSDYASTWSTHQASGSGEASAVAGPSPAGNAQTPIARRRLIDSLKREMPALVSLKHRLLDRYPVLSRPLKMRQAATYHKSHSFEAQPDRFLPVSKK